MIRQAASALLMVTTIAFAVDPPPMPKRAISPSTRPVPGQKMEINEGEWTFTLYVPQGWRKPQDEGIVLAVHFHGAVWFIIDEYRRAGHDGPLLCAQLGEGSRTYARPFEDTQRFGRLLAAVEEKLKARVSSVEISSFSAGYGAVRELLKTQGYFRLIHSIILCDSMYAGWGPGPASRPAEEHIAPWLAFAKAATRGEKRFVFTHSSVPTAAYASSADCAAALIEAVGARRVEVARGQLPATLDPDFPLLYRADLGRFHVWGYGGTDAQAHMTHPRHLADVIQALADQKPGASSIR